MYGCWLSGRQSSLSRNQTHLTPLTQLLLRRSLRRWPKPPRSTQIHVIVIDTEHENINNQGIVAQILTQMVVEHQRRRTEVTDEVLERFTAVRPMQCL